jgi:hypothetical protein
LKASRLLLRLPEDHGQGVVRQDPIRRGYSENSKDKPMLCSGAIANESGASPG